MAGSCDLDVQPFSLNMQNMFGFCAPVVRSLRHGGCRRVMEFHADSVHGSARRFWDHFMPIFHIKNVIRSLFMALPTKLLIFKV